MNYAFIDKTKKPSFISTQPEIYDFDTGNSLFIFPGLCRKRRLNRALSRYSYSFFPENCHNELKINIWYKIIVQAVKEYGLSEIIFYSEKYISYIELLTCFFKNNINFSIFSSGDCDMAADYFLEKYGLPVRTVVSAQSGILVFIDGFLPDLKNSVKILDLSGTLVCERITVYEYILKNTHFPITINSLPLLEGALNLTGKEIKDIIIKLCIIGTKCE